MAGKTKKKVEVKSGAVEVKPGTPEWLEERRKYIGASDAAAVLGISPWKQPFEVFLDKTGQLQDQPASKQMERGNILERAVGFAYEKKAREHILPSKFLVNEKELVGDPPRPFMAATPDGFLAGAAKRHVQIKTASVFNKSQWGLSGTDGAPDYYLIQVAHEMIVAETEECDIAVLFAGEEMYDVLVGMIEKEKKGSQKRLDAEILVAEFMGKMDLRIYTIRRDAELEKMIIEAERKFWEDCVMPGVAPDYDGSEAAAKYLSQQHPAAVGEMQDANKEQRKMIKMYQAAVGTLDNAEKTVERFKQIIIAEIGDNLGLVSEIGTVKYTNIKGRKTTAWQALAKELKASDAQIAKHTKIGGDTRRFSAKFK